MSNEDVVKVLKIGTRTIDSVKKKFVEDGFDAALEDKPTSRVYNRKADSEVEAHLVALSCSKAPEEFSKWTLQLLADKMVELEYFDHISYETVRRVLKKRITSVESKRLYYSTFTKQRFYCEYGSG